MKKATEIMMIIISFADTWYEQGIKAKKTKTKTFLCYGDFYVFVQLFYDFYVVKPFIL